MKSERYRKSSLQVVQKIKIFVFINLKLAHIVILGSL